MKHIIVGTAGHIDHGKTSLVKALTGIDADRLAEEKRRGITIDLGFAHLNLTPAIRLGFVDVPGHERFVKNMLAGVGGVDLVLFVIAADESIMPQTREHFDICRLLGIRAGVIALTKIDSVDADWTDLVQLEVEEFVAGSFLEGGPIIRVSSATGEGLSELRAALEEAGSAVTTKKAEGPARLPIDRAFSLPGFGTVVTGTLVSGSVSREDELTLLPIDRRIRVRGLQVHGGATPKAVAGSRAALNVPDLALAEIHRGMTLATPDRFLVTSAFDGAVELLPSARPLKNRSPVHFHAGTAELEAEIRLIGKQILEPGAKGFARILLREPAVLVAGDRFILRQFSPVLTIGGGSVIDVQPPRGRLRASIAARLEILNSADLADKVGLLVKETQAGIGTPAVAARLGVDTARVVDAARHAGLALLDPPGWITSKDWNRARRAEFVRVAQAFHTQHPLQPGIFRHDLRAQVMPKAPAFLFDALLASTPELTSEKDRVRSRTHRVVLKDEEQKAREGIENAFRAAGLAVPAVNDVLQQSGIDAARARAMLQILLKDGALVRVGEDLLFHRSAIEQLRAILAQHKAEQFTVATFKAWTGISRKYAVPLLEYCDRMHLTRRSGDLREIM
jgi:selenocysteine-specific elongation factor